MIKRYYIWGILAPIATGLVQQEIPSRIPGKEVILVGSIQEKPVVPLNHDHLPEGSPYQEPTRTSAVHISVSTPWATTTTTTAP